MARRSEVLDLAVEGKAKKKSRKGLIVGIAMLGVIPLVGSTLAATINLNAGSNIEFGQGTAAVVACDSSISLSPVASFSTSVFVLSEIQATNVDYSACTNKRLTVMAYSNGTVVDLASGTGTGITASVASSSTIVFDPTTTVGSNDFDRLTLESN